MKQKNKVKPTALQRKAFENMRSSATAQEAMIEAGYSEKTSMNPGAKLVDTAGFKLLIEEYREALKKQGISINFMSEVQASGLHDEDAKVRLEYLKETKKDFGIFQPDSAKPNILIGIGLNKKDYEW